MVRWWSMVKHWFFLLFSHKTMANHTVVPTQVLLIHINIWHLHSVVDCSPLCYADVFTFTRDALNTHISDELMCAYCLVQNLDGRSLACHWLRWPHYLLKHNRYLVRWCHIYNLLILWRAYRWLLLVSLNVDVTGRLPCRDSLLSLLNFLHNSCKVAKATGLVVFF